MRKLVLFLDTGFCGTDEHEFWLVPNHVSDEVLNLYAWQRAIEHAASFGIYPECDRESDEDEDEDGWDGDEYTDNIEGWWEPYEEDKHRGLSDQWQEW
jgi:hypothetical protein